MFWRIGLTGIRRTPWKTALFFFLIVLLALFLYLGVNTWASGRNMLRQCDETYVTIASLDYMGVYYPDETAYDPAMQEAIADYDFGALTALPGVRTWQPMRCSGGLLAGYETNVSDRCAWQNQEILIVRVNSWDVHMDAYVATVYDTLYDRNQLQGLMVFLYCPEGDVLEPGNNYIVHGQKFLGRTAYMSVRVTGFESAAAEYAGVDVSALPRTEKLPDWHAFLEAGQSPWFRMAQFYSAMNRQAAVWHVRDLDTLEVFHEKTLYLTQGRAFTPEETASDAKVCILTEELAGRTGLVLGDTAQLALLPGSHLPAYDSWWGDGEIPQAEDYTVVGLVNTSEGLENCIFIPDSSQTVMPAQSGYTLGTFYLENDRAEEFLAAAKPLLTERMRLTLYDEDYSIVSDTLSTIIRVSALVTAAASLAALAVLLLFAYLFVARQSETVRTMVFLGTPRRKAVGSLLVGCGTISLFASLAGCLVGYRLSGRILDAAYDYTLGANTLDLRYSDGAVGVARSFRPIAATPFWIVLATAAGLFVMCLLLCWALSVKSGRTSANPPQKKKKKLRVPKARGHSSTLPGGALKFALLSIGRGGARTAVVPLAALCIVIFLSTLLQTSGAYRLMLEETRGGTELVGHVTDRACKSVGGLAIGRPAAEEILDSGCVERVSVSISRTYLFTGICTLADGTLNPNFTDLEAPPENSFSMETLVNRILLSDSVVFTNDLRTAPEFYWADDISATYLPGWDESFLACGQWDVLPCLITNHMQEENGIALGDTIRVILGSERDFLDMMVVGAYGTQSGNDTIYCPFPASQLPGADLTEEEQLQLYRLASRIRSWNYQCWYFPPMEPPSDSDAVASLIMESSYHSMCFHLTGADSLSQLKEYLTQGEFSGPRRITGKRVFLLIEDSDFLHRVADLTQQIRYLDMLYPLLFILVGAVGLVVSFLMMNNRRGEIAVMRGVGTSKARTFLSFFLEQLLLCLGGTALGALGWFAVTGAFPLEVLPLFLLCYLAGSALSVALLNGSRVLALLGQND